MARSSEKALRNELTFRAANEAIREARERLPHASGPVPFLCECEEEGCTEILRVPLAEYAGVRADPRWFLLAGGHPHRGTVVEERDGYQVVEKDVADA